MKLSGRKTFSNKYTKTDRQTWRCRTWGTPWGRPTAASQALRPHHPSGLGPWRNCSDGTGGPYFETPVRTEEMNIYITSKASVPRVVKEWFWMIRYKKDKTVRQEEELIRFCLDMNIHSSWWSTELILPRFLQILFPFLETTLLLLVWQITPDCNNRSDDVIPWYPI